MKVGVELLVFDEPRPVQPQRNIGDPPAQLRHGRKTFHDEGAHPLKAVVRRIGGVVNRQSPNVHMPARRFGVPERRIYPRQPLHGGNTSPDRIPAVRNATNRWISI
ncbi:Uncharacterised protein [Mycobacteroides abscessus subsp. abscessus]|nr:Uncharacterised protein [Mycobacteroides abscessus subsp. abscessus]